MTDKPTVHTTQGYLTLTRSAVAEAFYCGRCKADKKAKAKARRVQPDGSCDLICNGCYGNILAQEEQRWT